MLMIGDNDSVLTPPGTRNVTQGQATHLHQLHPCEAAARILCCQLNNLFYVISRFQSMHRPLCCTAVKMLLFGTTYTQLLTKTFYGDYEQR